MEEREVKDLLNPRSATRDSARVLTSESRVVKALWRAS